MTFVVKKQVLLGGSLIALLNCGVAKAAPYEVIELGTLGGNLNFAYGINNLNEVVGSSEGPIIDDSTVTEDTLIRTCLVGDTISFREFCSHAYLFRSDTIYDLGELNTDQSYLFSINDQSTAVGYGLEEQDDGDDTTINPVRARAVISYDGANLEAMPYPAESEDMGEDILQEQRAQFISNDNKVIGYSLITTARTEEGVATNAFRPYIYDLDSQSFQILPIFEDEPEQGGGARAINNLGQVVGWAATQLEDGPNAVRALYWDPLNPEFSQDIGTLGGYGSSAWDINDNGFIVGVSDTDENFFLNEELAYVYDMNTEVMTQIPEFSDISEYRSSVAYAINNSNQVVGSAQVSASFGNLSAAFVYNVGDATLVNLNDMIDCELGWNLVIARDINEAGYITGSGTVNGEVRSFMLIPTSDTTPTNCTQPSGENPTDPVDDDDSGSGSTGIVTLGLLALFAMFRRRRSI